MEKKTGVDATHISRYRSELANSGMILHGEASDEIEVDWLMIREVAYSPKEQKAYYRRKPFCNAPPSPKGQYSQYSINYFPYKGLETEAERQTFNEFFGYVPLDEKRRSFNPKIIAEFERMSDAEVRRQLRFLEQAEGCGKPVEKPNMPKRNKPQQEQAKNQPLLFAPEDMMKEAAPLPF